MAKLDHLQPNTVFRYFEALCEIPHGSYNCKAVSDFCVDFARKRGLFVMQDDAYNVIIKKPASKDYQGKETLILQGHLDMVCQKTAESKIDFKRDGLDLAVDGDFVYAKNTTLGGDDGIAVAYALAILDDDTLKHPNLEIVFTTEEEVGMLGATQLDTSILEGKYLLNIDSEEEGILLAGCAGGLDANVTLSLSYEEKEGMVYTITIGGLKGGHSGTEINKNLANAHKLMGELLFQLPQVNIIKLWGDDEQKDNAIPVTCHAQVLVEDEQGVRTCIRELKQLWNETYADGSIEIRIENQGNQTCNCYDQQTKKRVITYLHESDNGIFTMDPHIDGFVESSLNLGILQEKEGCISFDYGVRSSVVDKKIEMINRLRNLSEKCQGTLVTGNDYPSWEYKEDSVLRDIFCETYEKLFGKQVKVETIHAGLECGIFAEKMQEIDIVAFGPDIFDIHTVQERLSISSTKRTWELLLKIIEEFP